MIDTYRLRKRLRKLHNELRSKGLNSVEVLDELSIRLGEVIENDVHLSLGLDGDAGDLVATVYQEVLTAEARNGLGQYLTPLPVADLLAEVVGGLGSPQTVMDPFCGVGLLLDRVGTRCPDSMLVGVEINRPIAQMARCLSKLSLREITVTEADAFALHLDGQIELVDAVVANPPFGAVVSEAELGSSGICPELRALGQLPAELLGFEICVQSLKPGGLLAIVLPQSILTNKTWDDFRSSIFKRIELVGVVALPEETFSPFRGVAKACVLFGRRTDCDLSRRIPFFTSRSVGYSATGRPVGHSDLDQIALKILDGLPADRSLEVMPDGSTRIESVERLNEAGQRLGDLCDVFVGRNPPAGAYRQQGPWILKVGDLAGSVIPWRTRQKNHVDLDWFSKLEKFHLRVSDVCLTAAGHRPKYIGLKVDIVDELPMEGALPSGEVMVLRLRADSNLPPEKLLFFLRSARGYEAIQDLVRGSTGHLYPRDLMELKIPPLDDLIPDSVVDAYREAVKAYRRYREHEKRAMSLAGVLETNEIDKS